MVSLILIEAINLTKYLMSATINTQTSKLIDFRLRCLYSINVFVNGTRSIVLRIEYQSFIGAAIIP